MRKIWCIVNFSDSWMRGFMLSQYESKWSFNTNRWHWPVTIRSWISGRSPKKFLSRWLRKMAKLERWRHPEAVTCFLRNWRYQCFPAVSFCKNLMQVMKFTMQSENFPCFSWRLLFSDCSGKASSAAECRLICQFLHRLALTGYLQGWTRGPGDWAIAERRKHGTHRLSV